MIKKVKTFEVNNADELMEVLDAITNDVVKAAIGDEEYEKTHTPFYISIDDIFRASAEVASADGLDATKDRHVVKHVSDMCRLLEERFLHVPEEDPTEEEPQEEEKLPGYKRRLRIEYKQVKKRYERLKKMLTKYEANTLEFELNCPLGLLNEQRKAMSEYLHCLEVRAEIENVTLGEE